MTAVAKGLLEGQQKDELYEKIKQIRILFCAPICQKRHTHTMMKLINFLRASTSHQHRLLVEFLNEVDAIADDLLLHNNVRWLSKGRLRSQKATQFSLFCKMRAKYCYFFWKTSHHLNEQHLKLQGKSCL
ncbi:hypothetical protein N1851_019371 [Merluccius polli]|uniref:Uncharacterized protein n=1 Tax=Merluccius polli TaxID=89951 RepID=A0AA47MLV4_MERPO|nr:hypothetical protein N1851_019371 [Merluccius polli]